MDFINAHASLLGMCHWILITTLLQYLIRINSFSNLRFSSKKYFCIFLKYFLFSSERRKGHTGQKANIRLWNDF